MFKKKNESEEDAWSDDAELLKGHARQESRLRSARQSQVPEQIHLSLVLPVREEAIRLGVALKRLASFLRSMPWRGEVLVVDDGSEDGTEQAAARWTRYFPDTIVVRHREAKGVGAAIRTGVLVSRGKYLVAIDPELRAPVTDITRILEYLENGADLVTASRHHPASQDSGETSSFLERASETAFRALSNLLMPTGGVNPRCDLLGLRRSSARSIAQRARVTGDAYLPEWLALAKRLGLRHEAVGLSWIEEPLPVRDEAEGDFAQLREMWRARQRLKKGTRVKPVAPDELLQETTFVKLERTSLRRAKGSR